MTPLSASRMGRSLQVDRGGEDGRMRRACRAARGGRAGRLPVALALAAMGCRGEAAPPPDAGEEVIQESAWSSLVAAENAFARRADEVGISPAFLEVLDEEGIVFAPGPLLGRTVHSERPAPQDVYLRWHPRFAYASAAGDLGYTSGPWVSGRGTGAPSAAGHYVSVWGRSEEDPWRLMVDIGISHAPLEDQEQRRAAIRFPDPVDPPGWTLLDAKRSLTRRQGLLHLVLAGDGQVPLTSLARPDAHVYAEGRAPGEGLAGLGDLVASGRVWSVAGSGMAASLDLAYAYGTLSTDGSSPSGNFLEIWEAAGGEWRLVLLLKGG